ncbi:acyl-CoA N-acyltransferase [Kalaharituber pfeilii]|nr:acyl-CoA N-acyltransferase [Kalaharituber pfeilii]
MDSLGEWSADANEALEISLVVPGADSGSTPQDLVTFSPKFTYPIFGENEAIYGYKGLKIRLRFAAHDLKPHLEVKYERKVKPVGEVKAEDVEEKIGEYLPDGFYTLDGKTYEIWHAPLMNEACKEILHNMQILVVFFIEGATPIDVTDEVWTNRRWDVYFLYEKTPESHYILTGYSTVYRYWYHPPKSAFTTANLNLDPPFTPTLIHSDYPDTTPDTFPCRARISQFLVFPPYQGLGHGSLFYDNLMSHLLSHPLVSEITVEEPSDAFEDLRHLRDLARLQNSGIFSTLSLPNLKSWPWDAHCMKSKLAPKQFAQVVELELLRTLNKKDPKLYKMYRVLVKGRIYKQNRDLLAQLDRLERIDKLEETYFHVEDDYTRLLKKLEGGGAAPAGEDGGRDEVMKDAEDGGRARKRMRM